MLVVVALVTVLVLAIGFWVGRRAIQKPRKVMFADEREETLAKRVAARAKSSLADALVSVRQELAFGSQASDETIIKRAVYHYQRADPGERKITYCDPVRG